MTASTFVAEQDAPAVGQREPLPDQDCADMEELSKLGHLKLPVEIDCRPLNRLQGNQVSQEDQPEVPVQPPQVGLDLASIEQVDAGHQDPIRIQHGLDPLGQVDSRCTRRGAILDRLLANVEILQIPGKSYRLVQHHLDDQEGLKAESTLGTERTHLSNLRKFLGPKTDLSVDRITEDDLKDDLHDAV